MIPMTIVTALTALGFESGWAANEHGITFWSNEEKQPTEAELIEAGWVKPDAEQPDSIGLFDIAYRLRRTHTPQL